MSIQRIAPLLLIPRCLVGNGFERMSRTYLAAVAE